MLRDKQESHAQERAEKQNQLKKGYAIVFAGERGLNIIEDLKREVDYDNTGFNVSSERATAFNLGRKDLLNYILKQIRS